MSLTRLSTWPLKQLENPYGSSNLVFYHALWGRCLFVVVVAHLFGTLNRKGGRKDSSQGEAREKEDSTVRKPAALPRASRSGLPPPTRSVTNRVTVTNSYSIATTREGPATRPQNIINSAFFKKEN